MKIPLHYQISEFDCGPTSVINAISRLFEVDEIPQDFIKTIYNFSLDGDEFALKCGGYDKGTSVKALRDISIWLNEYALKTGYPIRSDFYLGDEVNFSKDSVILKCLLEKGTAVIRCKLMKDEHYITLTGMDETRVYAFDPYIVDYDAYTFPDRIKIIKDRPFEMNRVIDILNPYADDEEDYALCPPERRCAMLIFRTSARHVSSLSPAYL